MKNENNVSNKENLHVQVDYRISGKQINYTVFAVILGLLGYPVYFNSDPIKEISGLDKQPVIVEMRENITELQKSVVVYDAMIADDVAKSNTKVIEGILND